MTTTDTGTEVYAQLLRLAEVGGVMVTELIHQAALSYQEHWRQSVVPAGARLIPDHWLCRLRRHQGLRWSYEIEPLHPGTRTRIVFAQCTHCGRHQSRVRVMYQPSHTFTVTRPTTPEPGEADHTLEDSAQR
jgi:hypothetical protein